MKKFETTKEIKIPEKLIDQVIGQDSAVKIIKKAARQNRNVLLIGSPGTGKSMLAQAMAELMPSEELEDVLVYKNPNNDNNPLIRVVKTYPNYEYLKKHPHYMQYYTKPELIAIKSLSMNGGKKKIPDVLKIGLGRRITSKKDMQENMTKGPPNSVIILLVGIILLGVIFFAEVEENLKWLIIAALLGISILYILSGATAGLARRLSPFESDKPKLIVDNSGKKNAPFVDATGTKAGALLGDCKHDPLQCFFPNSTVYKLEQNKNIPEKIEDIVEKLLAKYSKDIEKNENYSGVCIPEKENEYVLGYLNGKIMPVRILAVNKGKISKKLSIVENNDKKLLVTPEHKIFVDGEYIEAKKITDENLKTYDIEIISKIDIIRTYSKTDQKSAQDYYKFLELKRKNPKTGYRKIAKILGIKTGQTRWWNNNTRKPKAVQSVERLEKLGLLPFKTGKKDSYAIARILGTTFGDGGVFSTLNGIFLSSSEEKSIDDYAQDMISIFGEDIGKNFRRIISGVNNTGMCISNSNRDVVRFFVALGAPVGRKNKEIQFPKWIHLDKNIEKEFFGAFLGNELCSPKYSEKENKIQYFGVGIAGEKYLENNRKKLLREIMLYLKSYDIKTTEKINENEFRKDKFIWRMQISTDIENIIRFYELIPLRYSDKKTERIRHAMEKVMQRKLDKYSQLKNIEKSERYILSTLKVSNETMQKILMKQEIDFNCREIEYNGFVYNITTESGNLFANGILVKNSGGMGTPAHLRIESGAIQKANKGVLFIDEIASLKMNWQQEILTAMQEKKYAITGQSENSSGALVKTEPTPSDFVLVASGNLPDLKMIHPALRSRIRGAGYEIYMEDEMDDNEPNEEKLVQFIAQEIRKDRKIPEFTYNAVLEIIDEARKASGRKRKFTMNLRELGGLIRAAGDVAREENSELVNEAHVEKGKKISVTIENQLGKKIIERKKDYQIIMTSGSEIGRVNGLAVLGDVNAGLVLPIVAEITPASSKSEGRVIATGKLGTIAKEAVMNVSAIIKKYMEKDISQKDIHIQFLQTYEGLEGDSASISIAVAVISALEGIPVRQDFAMTGSLDVRGEVLPVGGVSGKLTAAVDSGIINAIVPESNFKDIFLSKGNKEKIKINKVKNFVQVLNYALADCSKKRLLMKKIEKMYKGNR
ncbi:MAG: ATP-dependent protease LonB [Candidatus Micrarchaeia archaeon]